MGKVLLLLGGIILSSSVTTDAEPPPVNIRYPMTGDPNVYEYGNGLSSDSYVGGKADYMSRNGDFYSRGGQFALTGNGSPMTIGAGPSYGSQDSGFTGFASGGTTPRDSLTENSYSSTSHMSPNLGGVYSLGGNGNTKAESSYGGYSAGIGRGPSEVGQFISSGSSHGTSSYDGFPTRDMPGSTTFAGYAESAARVPNIVEYSVSSNHHHQHQHHPDASGHSYASAYPSDYTVIKHKGRRNKYRHDLYPAGTEQHYSRGNRGTLHTGRTHGPAYPSGSRSSGLITSMLAHSPTFYGTEKAKKHVGSKYIPAYASTATFSYLPREHEGDYVSGSYVKGPGKIIVIKESGPGKYGGGPVHTTGSSMSNGMLPSSGSYKGKGSGFATNYDGGPYAANPSFTNALSSTAYGDLHMPRGYATTSGHLSNTRHVGAYPDYS